MVNGFAGLIDLAVSEDSKVVETTLGNIKKVLNKNGLAPELIKSFIKTFGLFHRPSWEKPPEGFKNRDLNPWRYSRRLSVVVRPLLIFGENDEDKVFYGAGALKMCFGYLLDRTEQGQFPDHFFTSKKMISYVGAVNDKRGHDFAKFVAKELKKKGWEVRNEVNMTELEAPRELADGDIDVLAWKQNGDILIIECKRLQFARTIAEIAEICKRFKGEAKDLLDKHVRRVKWIRNNSSSLERIIGFKPDIKQIDERLITNTHVPMMYLTTLPIESEKIGPLTSFLN